MRKFLFVLASTGSLATMNVAIVQYPATDYYATGYYVPGYYGPRYYARGYPWLLSPLAATPPGGSVGATVGTNNAGNTGFVGECAKGFSEDRQVKTNQPG